MFGLGKKFTADKARELTNKSMDEEYEQELDKRMINNYQHIKEEAEQANSSRQACFNDGHWIMNKNKHDQDLTKLRNKLTKPEADLKPEYTIEIKTNEDINKYFSDNRMRSDIFKALLKDGYKITIKYRWGLTFGFEACWIKSW